MLRTYNNEEVRNPRYSGLKVFRCLILAEEVLGSRRCHTLRRSMQYIFIRCSQVDKLHHPAEISDLLAAFELRLLDLLEVQLLRQKGQIRDIESFGEDHHVDVMKQRNLRVGHLLVVSGVDISQCLPHDVEAAADVFQLDKTILRLQSRSSVSLVGSLRAHVIRTYLGIRKTRPERFRSWPKDGAVYHYDVALVFDPKVRIRTVPKTIFMSVVDAKAEISMLTRRHPAS
jgi:hypothetical protein